MTLLARSVRGLYAFAILFSSAAACSTNNGNDPSVDGGQPTGDGGVGDPDSRRPDSGDPGEPTEVCPPPVQPVTLQNPRVVGTGTRDSCNEDALRSAIAGGGHVSFSCGAGKHAIAIRNTLRIERDTVIDGGHSITVDGGDAARIFSVAANVRFTVQNLGLARGRAKDEGAAIHAHDPAGGSSVTVIHCTFADNTCTDAGPDIGGAAIYAYGADVIISGSVFRANRASNGGAIGNMASELTVVNSIFVDNEATGTGGGAEVSGKGGIGGAIYVDGMRRDRAASKLTLCGDTFRNNRSTIQGGAIFTYFYPGQSSVIDRCSFVGNEMVNPSSERLGLGGAIYHQEAPLTLTNSTIANNRSNHMAGGIYLGPKSPTTIRNCTIAGNRAEGTPGNAGGLWTGDSKVTIESSTIARNHGSFGPGIYGDAQANVTLTNTIIAHNGGAGEYNGQNCDRAFANGGGNLQFPAKRANGTDDTACIGGIRMADPMLADLADNGGPTPTMALRNGSAAIDSGEGTCPATDQRGEARRGKCDTGAYEF